MLNSGIIYKSAKIRSIRVYPRAIINIATFFLSLLSLLATGQIPYNVKQKKIDRLLTRLEISTDTAYVNTLNDLSVNLADRDFDSAYSYAQEALALARKYNYPKGEGTAFLNTGNCYFVKMDLMSALQQYFKALKILEPLGPSMDLENLYFQMGFINCLVPNNNRAFEFFHKTLNTSLAIGDTLWGGIGACYELTAYYWQCWKVENYPEGSPLMDSAIIYSNLALQLMPCDTIRNLDILVDGLAFNGLILSCLGKEEAFGQFKKALHFAQKMQKSHGYSSYWLDMFDTTRAEWYIGICYLNLGAYYFGAFDDFKLGEEYLLKSLDVLKKTDHIEVKAIALSLMGYLYSSQKKYDKAIPYFREAISTCDTFITYADRRNHLPSWTRLRYLSNTKSNKANYLKDLATIYETTGDIKNALEHRKMAEEADKNQMMSDFDYQIDLLQTNYENDNASRKIASLNSENELNKIRISRTRGLLIGTGVIAVLLVFMVALYFQRNKLKAEQKSLVLEQKLLRAQMNPHFLFNSLYSIQNFIVTERPDKASIYLSKFAKLVRNILDNSTEEFVVLEKEISTIENYLELQKVRYAGKFDFRIDVDNNIDIDFIKIPPMLAQPFIENAIEHGIKHRETPGHISIRFSLMDDTLVFEVEDDGIGRQKAREIEILREPGHRSMATSLTHERLANLNRKLHRKIFLEIIDMKNALGEATGTRVVFGVPVGH